MGIDLVTGEKLSWQERGISLVCMFVPVVSGKAVTKGGKKLFVSVSKIPGKVKKVRNVVSKNTLKIKVSLKKVWSATKKAVKINFRKGKDCVVKLKQSGLDEWQKLKESGHTFLGNVKKIKNGEFYQYECAMPDGQRIPISGWDDTPKSKKVCSKGSSGTGYKTLSKGKFKHIFNRHTYDNVKNQLGHVLENAPRSDVEAEISTRGFFNKNWSEQDIMSGVENAYNELLQNGMNNGNYVVKIKGVLFITQIMINVRGI